MKDSEIYLPFWEHIEELRGVLIRIFAIIACGICLSLYFSGEIISILSSPLQKLKTTQIGQATVEEEIYTRVRIHNSGLEKITYLLPATAFFAEQTSGVQQVTSNSFVIPSGEDLFIYKKSYDSPMLIGPLEGISIAVKLSLLLGVICTSPFWALIALKFIMPALRRDESRLILPFFMTSLLFIGLGLLLAFYVTIPLANYYLYAFNQQIGINLWSLGNYLNFTLFVMLANATAFELFAIGIFMVHLGYLTSSWLAAQRRMMIVGAFILGALLTPPDVLTQFLMAGLLIGLYEFLIIYAKIKELGRKNTVVISYEHG